MDIDVVRKKELLMEKKLRACSVNIIPRVGLKCVMRESILIYYSSQTDTFLPLLLLPQFGLALLLHHLQLPVQKLWRRPVTR